MRKPLRRLMRTRQPRSTIVLRLWLAALLGVAGLRAVGLNPFLGKSLLAESPFGLGGAELKLTGVGLCLCAALLAAGLLTRLVALGPLLISVLIIRDAWPRVGGLWTASALDSILLAGGAAAVSLLLVLKGAGGWSLDASFAGRGR